MANYFFYVVLSLASVSAFADLEKISVPTAPAKKAYRDVKDQTCEWINGKLECAAEKVKHKIQNKTDEMKDKKNRKGEG